MFDAEYFCNPNVFTFLFNKRHLYNSVSRGCFSVSLDKMRIINRKKINLLNVTNCVTHVRMHFAKKKKKNVQKCYTKHYNVAFSNKKSI